MRASDKLSIKESASRKTIYVVCPTPFGGHIEHAANLAMGISAETQEPVVVLTRCGAKAYLPEECLRRIAVDERLSATLPRGERSLFVKFLDFIKEQYILIKIACDNGTSLIIFEEPRYPWLGMLRRFRPNMSATALILHNVMDHGTETNAKPKKPLGTVNPKLVAKSIIKNMTVRDVGGIFVHGEEQLTKFTSAYPNRKARAVELPVVGPVDKLIAKHSGAGDREIIGLVKDSLVCIGEIRSNKGYELAIMACQSIGQKLIIIGASIDHQYTTSIKNLVRQGSGTIIVDKFVDTDTFLGILDNCKAILLPYSQFDAQSGILAKCISRGTPFLSSDLRSLTQQADGSELATFFNAGDSHDLATAMTDIKPRGRKIDDDSELAWRKFARALTEVRA